MDPFVLPDELPTSAAELAALAAAAQTAFDAIAERVAAGEDLTSDELASFGELANAIETIDTAAADVAQAEADRRDQASAIAARIAGRGEVTDENSAPQPTPEEIAAAEAAAVAEAEAAAAAAAESTENTGAAVTAGAPARRANFSAAAQQGSTAAVDIVEQRERTPGWRMEPNTFGYRPGKVGFAELAQVVDSVRSGSKARSNRADRGGFAAQTLARLDREVTLVEDSHALVAAIEAATDQTNVSGTGQSLVAAGGWCAPSEQLYDFCDVPEAVDLVSLPEITINRGGVRWPVEPDLSEIFESFQFFFNETQLEAVDAEGNPTAIKQCVEIPCPDEFEEIRLNAVGYCVEAGILQTQGWPELIEWFMRSLTAEHLRAISRRTILDMVAGSGPAKIIPADTTIGAVSSVLNALALQAVNLRLNKGLSRTATIEGVAPSWFHEVLRADLAMQEGTATKAITDAQIDGWLTARNIVLQYVGDWQTRSAGLPGNLATLVYPGTIDVLLYPAGTWFRSMSNVIELGVMYPKEQLQVNRYTRFFTEDAIAVGKRCNQSILVRLPICVSGAIGARETVACNTELITP